MYTGRQGYWNFTYAVITDLNRPSSKSNHPFMLLKPSNLFFYLISLILFKFFSLPLEEKGQYNFGLWQYKLKSGWANQKCTLEQMISCGKIKIKNFDLKMLNFKIIHFDNRRISEWTRIHVIIRVVRDIFILKTS